jgi:hypothetical protein
MGGMGGDDVVVVDVPNTSYQLRPAPGDLGAPDSVGAPAPASAKESTRLGFGTCAIDATA